MIKYLQSKEHFFPQGVYLIQFDDKKMATIYLRQVLLAVAVRF